MKSKTIDIVLSLLVILIFCMYFGIRHQVYKTHDLIDQLELAEQYIKEEKWNEAIESSHEVENKWDRVKFIVIVNSAEEDISTMEEYVNLFIGGTETKDATSALSSSMHLKDLWNNMQKLVPQP